MQTDVHLERYLYYPIHWLQHRRTQRRNVMHNKAQAITVNSFKKNHGTLLSAFLMFHTAGHANAITSAIYGGKIIFVSNTRDTYFICDQLQKSLVNVMIWAPAL
jgi:long-chain acyl-CoA synthetase